MKKLYLFALTAIVLAACSAPPTNRDAVTTTNSNKPAETKAAAPLTEADAIAKEKEIWQALTKKDLTGFGAMLAEDQIYVSGDGVHDKASTIKSVTGFVPTTVDYADWKLVPINNDAVVLIYKATVKGTMNGSAVPEGAAYTSSIWVNRDGKWLALYHQDSDVKPLPPAPPAKAPAKAAASPTASAPPAAATATTSSDAEANEKAVWDSFKAKHFDAFESMLAPEFTEVEPFGVTNRAESVKGVQTFDFSKTTLSDWKTVKINPDATLVTYVAHLPGEKVDTEYHSTVWANRNGKWLAVFHQGTHKAAPAPATPAKAASPAAAK